MSSSYAYIMTLNANDELHVPIPTNTKCHLLLHCDDATLVLTRMFVAAWELLLLPLMLNLRSLDVSDNATSGVVQKLDTDLGHGTGVSGSAQNVLHLGKFH